MSPTGHQFTSSSTDGEGEKFVSPVQISKFSQFSFTQSCGCASQPQADNSIVFVFFGGKDRIKHLISVILKNDRRLFFIVKCDRGKEEEHLCLERTFPGSAHIFHLSNSWEKVAKTTNLYIYKVPFKLPR